MKQHNINCYLCLRTSDWLYLSLINETCYLYPILSGLWQWSNYAHEFALTRFQHSTHLQDSCSPYGSINRLLSTGLTDRTVDTCLIICRCNCLGSLHAKRQLFVYVCLVLYFVHVFPCKKSHLLCMSIITCDVGNVIPGTHIIISLKKYSMSHECKPGINKVFVWKELKLHLCGSPSKVLFLLWI